MIGRRSRLLFKPNIELFQLKIQIEKNKKNKSCGFSNDRCNNQHKTRTYPSRHSIFVKSENSIAWLKIPSLRTKSSFQKPRSENVILGHVGFF